MSDEDDFTLALSSTDDFVELGVKTQNGRLFRKELITFGEYAHPKLPGVKMKLDETVASSIINNFQAKMCTPVQVPVATSKNEHTEDPDRNLGEVIGLDVGKNSKGKDALFMTLDCRDANRADKLGKTILGTSAFIHMNYTDTKSGKKVGPTLLHACATNRPYITDMDGYEEVKDLIAASATDEDGEVFILGAPVVDEEAPATEEPPKSTPSETDPSDKPTTGEQHEEIKMTVPTFEELKAVLKDEYKVDLDEVQDLALSATTATAERDEALAQLEEIQMTNSAETDEAVLALTAQIDEQGEVIQTLLKDRAITEVDGLIKAGKILPKQKESMVTLALTNRSVFEGLIPEEAIVSLTETGVESHSDADTAEARAAEEARVKERAEHYAAQAASGR